jgi:hypothetical protein
MINKRLPGGGRGAADEAEVRQRRSYRAPLIFDTPYSQHLLLQLAMALSGRGLSNLVSAADLFETVDLNG